MNKESTQNVPECIITETNSQKRMAMTKKGDEERTLDMIREEDENETSYERKNRLGGRCGEEESESDREEVLGGEREKFENVKEIKETDRGEEYNIQVGREVMFILETNKGALTVGNKIIGKNSKLHWPRTCW